VECIFELFKLVRQDKGLWNEVKIRFRVFVLHSEDVSCEFIFTREFTAQWKMVNLLSRSQSLVEVSLSLGVCPKHVPVMSVCVH